MLFTAAPGFLTVITSIDVGAAAAAGVSYAYFQLGASGAPFIRATLLTPNEDILKEAYFTWGGYQVLNGGDQLYGWKQPPLSDARAMISGLLVPLTD